MAQWYTPDQRQKFRQQLWQKLDKYPWGPLDIIKEKRMTFFNNEKKYSTVNKYDAVFNQPQTYDQKMRRCDRVSPSIRRENIFQEEKSKIVPAFSSLWYARPTLRPYDAAESKHRMVSYISSMQTKSMILAPDLEPQGQIISRQIG